MKLSGRTVLITGASAGIGAACARAFAEEGARLILCARRAGRLEEAAEKLRGAGTDVLLLELDVRDQAAVMERIAGLPAEWREIDVLVNNAGLGRGMDKLWEGSPADWDEMVDTNVKGLLYVTRAVVPGMAERKRGHVINLGSVAGHEVYPGGAVYCATKHAVGAITRGLRMDVLGTGIRVSTVDPGMVETEFSVVRFHGDEARAKNVYRGMTALTADDIAETIVWVATRPPHVCIDEVIIKPTDQASATLVHRTT
ncbi:SDR family oxidoreductase [Longimicrobium sp.]|uniref:SDR family oxidoreductase n=1 Tax=Longimicrobium sp. TaxID=2029185 RepID=UPI002C9E4995|nr:SDR family oxidoreductase [Longimicrobium sp.]HSU13874.1 SDR family oxidoreductase [Longimicrobium sp.]